MKVVIIEDEHLAAEKLKEMILSIDDSIQVASQIDSIKKAIKWLGSNAVDLIFLDIQLSDGISFSIFDHLEINTPVIITTAFNQYAIRAFKLNSIAYLLKPIRRVELEDSLAKFHQLRTTAAIDFDFLIKQIQNTESPFKKRFIIQIGSKIEKINAKDVAYFFVRDKGVFVRTFQNKSYPLDYSLDKLEGMLNPSEFFRINRKYIIHLSAIEKMMAYSRSRIKIALKPKADNDLDTIVSVERSAKFKRWLDR